MKIAIVADVHGNRRAFAAVLADLKQVAPDLAVHGGDLQGFACEFIAKLATWR